MLLRSSIQHEIQHSHQVTCLQRVLCKRIEFISIIRIPIPAWSGVSKMLRNYTEFSSLNLTALALRLNLTPRILRSSINLIVPVECFYFDHHGVHISFEVTQFFNLFLHCINVCSNSSQSNQSLFCFVQKFEDGLKQKVKFQ